MLGIYVRNYGRTDIASQEQIRDLVLMSDNTPYDRPFGEDIYRSEDYTKLGDIVSERGCDINEKTLISKGIISTEKNYLKEHFCLRMHTMEIGQGWYVLSGQELQREVP